MSHHTKPIDDLKSLLNRRNDLKNAVQKSVEEANRLDEPTLDNFYTFLEDSLENIPKSRSLLPNMNEFYYQIDQDPNGLLQEDEEFNRWIKEFTRAWGDFLNEPESAEDLDTFRDDPDFKIEDYYEAPGGWRTFNQFFARHVKPGKRPIQGLCNDDIVTSPADSTFKDKRDINLDENPSIEVKGVEWQIGDLIQDSEHADIFSGGTFCHMFLSVRDYHRYHTPVRGEVKETKIIDGKYALDVEEKDDGSLHGIDGDTYQFNQERGLIVYDSPVGYVGMIPVGMAIVSSIELLVEEGIEVAKGDEAGYFLFGGSDVILLFEEDAVELTAEPGQHHLMGEKIGEAK
ncbi:MAG: phosphatidylserine decarboxylase [Halobacteria archaeon]